ncbi:MAG: PilN domain-containing protein [Xylophilus ampelinus]
MILINLLPHRVLARKRRRDAFHATLLGAAIAGVLVAAGVYLLYQSRIADQQARNQYLQSEIQVLDNQIKQIASLESEITALRARQAAVEGLQSDRNMPVHLLNELARRLPDGVYLTEMKQDGQTVAIKGVAQSNERVSELLRNLGESTWLASPQLGEIASASLALTPRDTRRVSNFAMTMRLLRASDLSPPAAGAAAPARATPAVPRS